MTVGYVPVAELYCSDDGIVLNLHLVVVLVLRLQASEYGNTLSRARFIHHNHLEPSFQGFVLLKILLVLVQCR